MGHLRITVQWDLALQARHRNRLELKAIFLALLHWEKWLKLKQSQFAATIPLPLFASGNREGHNPHLSPTSEGDSVFGRKNEIFLWSLNLFEEKSMYLPTASDEVRSFNRRLDVTSIGL